AVDGAMIAKMRNAGEACTAANRFYIESSVAQEFSKHMAESIAAVTVRTRTDPETEVGPLVNAETVDKVDRLVQGATAAGASIVVGGDRPGRGGVVYEPTGPVHG